MAAMEVTKTRPWDNIMGWEHRNSFSRPPEDYNNVPRYRNLTLVLIKVFEMNTT